MGNTRTWAPSLGAWFLGAAAVAVPWVAIRFVPVDVNQWASVYIGGCLGGLVLELLLGRGRLELPSPSPATAEEQKSDERRPLGPQLDIGFFARVASGGLASVALLVVYYTLVDAADAERLTALAGEPTTFGWAVFLGASSPAVWTVGGRLVEGRLSALQAREKQLLEQYEFVAEKLEEAKAGVSGGARLDLDATVQRVTAGVEPVIAEAAQATPHTVDVHELALTVGEDVTKLLAGTMYEITQPASSAPGATAALDEALGVVKAELRRT